MSPCGHGSRVGRSPGNAGGGFPGCRAAGWALGGWNVYFGQPALAVLITRCDHACRERPPQIIFSSHPLGSSRQGEKWYNAVGGYCEKPLQRISHSVMETGIFIWAPLVLSIYLFIYLFGFSRSLLLLMYYLYSRKLDSEDSSILQISFLILSIKNAQAAGALAGDEPCRSESCPWSLL